MRMLRIVLVFIVVFLASNQITNAQNITQGNKQVGLNIYLDPTTVRGANLSADASYGYFFWDYLLLGGGLSFETDDDVNVFYPYGFVEKLFPMGSPMTFFIGGGLGYYSLSYSDESINSLIFRVSGGAKYFINENTAIQSRANIHFSTDDVFVNSDDYERTNSDFTIDMGIVLYF